jgi:hypothetical protein
VSLDPEFLKLVNEYGGYLVDAGNAFLIDHGDKDEELIQTVEMTAFINFAMLMVVNSSRDPETAVNRIEDLRIGLDKYKEFARKNFNKLKADCKGDPF